MFNFALENCSTLIKGLELFLYTFVASAVEVKHGKIQNTLVCFLSCCDLNMETIGT